MIAQKNNRMSLQMKRCFSVLFILLTLFAVYAHPQTEKLSVAMDIAKGDIINLNPYTASDSTSVVILDNLYDGLFAYDAQTGRPVPSLAESYSVSEDGLSWTFHLRTAYFSDHSPITSESFKESWNYLIQGPLASNLDFLSSVETPDSSTLTVNLKHPVSYLPSLLCQPCLAAVKPTDSSLFSGAYRVVFRDESRIKLKKNNHYWDSVGCPEVVIHIGTETDFSSDFLSGSIHWSLAPVENASQYMEVSPLYGTTFLYFSSSDGIYSDNDMQSALAQLVPVDYIRIIQSSIIPSDSLVPQSGAYAEYEKQASNLFSTTFKRYNIRSAADLPVLHIAVHRGDSTILTGQLIQEIWSETLKGTVSLDTVPSTVYTTDPAENPYDFCIITWIADYYDPAAFLSLFRSDASYSLANYSNTEYDHLLDLADSLEDRQSYLLEAEKILLNSGTVIPISTAVSTNFVRSDLIEGWYPNLLDIHPLKNIRFK